MPEPFDQLLYYETNEPLISSSTGVGPAATSLSYADLTYWHDFLFPMVSVDHPYETLCYIVPDDARGRAALMYRSREMTTRALPFSHVLIGPQDELTPRLALGSFGWNWQGARKKRLESGMKILPKIDGEEIASFVKTAEAGWESVAERGTRPPEVDQLIVDIRDYGGAGDGPLPFDDLDSLSSLGESKFLILSRLDGASDDHQAHARLPIQVLARLLRMLDGNKVLAKRLIGTGFSTHETKYRSEYIVPRWVFATNDDLASHGLDRLVVDLRNSNPMLAERNKEEADQFGREFRAALEEYASDLAEPDGQAPGAPQIDPAQQEPPRPEAIERVQQEPLRPEAIERVQQETPPAGELPVPEPPDQPPGLSGDDSDTRDSNGTSAVPASPGPQIAGMRGSSDLPTAETAARTFSLSPVTAPAGSSSQPGQLQQDRTEFADWPDDALISVLLGLKHNQFSPMIRELSRRTAPKYQAEQRSLGTQVDAARARAMFIEKVFLDKGTDEYEKDMPLTTDLYYAICRFITSDQHPEKPRPEVARELLSMLASNHVYRGPANDGGYSPLASAIIAALWPQQGNVSQAVVPYDFTAEVKRLVGDDRSKYLGMRFEPPPEADRPQRPDAKARPVLSAKNDALTLLAVVAVLMVAVYIGYYL